MSFGNAIIAALFFTSYVTGITDTAWKDAERAVCCLADVANIRRTELAIDLNNAKWYKEGMELFAYRLSGYYWIKRTITWTVTNHKLKDENMPPEKIERILTEAFQKWAAASGSRLRFPRVSPGQKADIEINFKIMPSDRGRIISDMEYPCNSPGAFDNAGGPVRILINRLREWSPIEGVYYYNLRSVALQRIGNALGIHDSDRWDAVMNPSISKFRDKTNSPALNADDISALQAVLNKPSSSGSTSGTHGHAGSVSSESTTRALGRMSLGSSGPPTGSYGRGNPRSSGPPSRMYGRGR